MKILQVTPYFYPAWSYGGVPRVAYEISKRLVKRGHEVTVYTTDALDKRRRVKVKNNPEYIDGIRTFYFKNFSNYVTYKYHFPLPLGMIRQVKKEIKNFDIIHLHGYRHFLNAIVYHYADYKIPYIIQAHGSLLTFFTKAISKRLYDLVWGYRLLKNACKVIALTETEKEQYKKLGIKESKIEIVPNGIDLTEYQNLPEKGTFRKKFGIKDNEKIILYVGRLHKSKGIDLLVKAFSKISQKLDDTKLVLVGPDDGYKAELTNLLQRLKINNKTILTGFVSEKEKLAAFVDADVFVTTVFYGFPVTFLEACVCGVPIITTNRGDRLSWINKVGVVVKYDMEELKEALLNILYDKRLKKIYAIEEKKLIEKKFKWDVIIRRLEYMYKKCTRGENE